MTRIPRILDRNRKPRRAPASDPWSGYEPSYQVFDETNARLLEMFANDSIGAAARRLTDTYRWSRGQRSPATQQVTAMIDRLYANDIVSAQNTHHWIDKHLWTAAVARTPGWLQHAPHPKKDPTALAEASNILERACGPDVDIKAMLEAIEVDVKTMARMTAL